MKLPKNFGGQGLGGYLKQAQAAMDRAKHLEDELAAERITIEKGPVSGVFAGTGEIVSIKIDPVVMDPSETEALEDLIVGLVRDGFSSATELRDARVKEIMPNVPGLGNLGL
ncbi:MAG: YbaB/EbfC family nucleoid-associated protein [Fimbriimonadaceae bacterium]|nr:YbaB/EbfC family nucleoid-associated protein [Fimbriimonadaceae bacterium]